jgi:hypothetical protein
MRRAELFEADIDRLIELGQEAGVSVRVAVDRDGEATLVAGGLGTFENVESLERALGDAVRAAA